jgi:hypothetical protein
MRGDGGDHSGCRQAVFFPLEPVLANRKRREERLRVKEEL